MDELPLFTHWYDTLSWMLKASQRFPKSYRMTLTARFVNLGLDLMEKVHALRYTRKRGRLFRQTDLALDRLRVLSRLMAELKVLSFKQYEQFSMNVDEAGRMLGGWKKSL